jgi:hypothetical protein
MNMDVKSSEQPGPVSPKAAPEPTQELEAGRPTSSLQPNDDDGDVEMDDSPLDDSTATVVVTDPPSSELYPTKEPLAAPNSPRTSLPPPDPSPDQRSSEEPESDQGPSPHETHHSPPADASKSPEMRVSMPPPPTNPFAATPQSSNGALTNTIVQSPATLAPGSSSGPVFSPSVTAAVASGPTRKKLSLSDYTRRKKEQPSDSKPDRESSPASVTSGPTSAAAAPSLQASASEIKSAQESGSAVVEEDVKMDDAAPSSSS